MEDEDREDRSSEYYIGKVAKYARSLAKRLDERSLGQRVRGGGRLVGEQERRAQRRRQGGAAGAIARAYYQDALGASAIERPLLRGEVRRRALQAIGASA